MMNTYYKHFSVYILVLIVFITVSCDRDKPSGEIIAKVGREKIYRENFDVSFVLNPQYAIRTPMRKARQSQINFLINQKYFYLAAQQVGLQDDPVIQNRLKYIKNQEILKGYIHKNFLNRIAISDTDLIKSHARLSKKIRVQHLFTEKKSEADSLWGLLTQGQSFKNLARNIYRDSILSETGGDLGFIGFGDMDPQLEEKAYTMKIGEVSPPVPSAYGYHILKILDIQQNEQFQTTPEPVKIKTVNEILQTRSADKAIRAHLKELAGDRQIQVSNRVMEVLLRETIQVMGNRYEEANLFQPQIYSGDLNRIERRVEDILDEVLVQFGDEEIRVGDYLERLKQMPPLHRPYLKTRTRMTQAIIDMVRNDLILKEAHKQGIQKDPDVKESIKEYSEETLAAEFQKRLYSENFKGNNASSWEVYSSTYQGIKDKTRVTVNYDLLYENLPETDTLMAPEPIQLFLKSRYSW